MKHGSGLGRFAPPVFAALLALATSAVEAAIPASERNALVNFYNSTGGAGWTTSTNWNGAPGTECSWYGVTCDVGQTTVRYLMLPNNNLTGSLPALSGLTGLQFFNIDRNRVTGAIPVLAGMILQAFSANDNQLTGSIPVLNGVTTLTAFDVGKNQLSGTLPSLAGLTALQAFVAYNNQLTGSIPSLSGLANLYNLNVGNNLLTGDVPSLAGLSNLGELRVSGNNLTGDMPPAPSPNALSENNSTLCPNQLNHTPDPDWDAATGVTPWYQGCTAAPGAPGAAASPDPLDFGSQAVGTASAARTITVTNTGNADLHVSSVARTGAHAGDLTLTSDNCTGFTVAPSGNCILTLTFTPGAAGARSATVSIASDATGSPLDVAVSGNGIAADPASIPTLSEWGLLLLSLLVAGTVLLRRGKSSGAC